MLSRPLTEMIEEKEKHWVTEVERSRNITWNSHWQRIDRVALELKTHHPESFRPKLVRCRNGEQREIWAFTKVIRLKKYGRKRLVIVHEKSDLSDAPRFLLTNALHWDASRKIYSTSFGGNDGFIVFLILICSLLIYKPSKSCHECVFGVLALESEPVDPRL